MSEQIRVSTEVWKTLNAQKQPGDSFDDAIRRIIENNPDVELLEADGVC